MGEVAEPNQDLTVAWRFHEATKYVPASDGDDILMGVAPHLGPAIGEQNPAIEPLPYKMFLDLEPIQLPREFPTSHLPALEAIAATGEIAVDAAVPNFDTIARLCLRANGVLKRWRAPSGREIEFRAAGCTGARYHLELYLVCGDLPGLAAGVYHYAAHDHSLRRLRTGDYRGEVVKATGQESAIATAPVVAIWTSTFWRNAWRYQARAYRHVYWDAGTALANLLAVAADAELPARVVLGFADAEINALLDIDGQREAAVVLVALGRWDEAMPATPPVAPLDLATRPISAQEIVFAEIGAMHDGSLLASDVEVANWRAGAYRPATEAPAGAAIPLQPLPAAALPTEPIDDVVARRRSNRHYAAEMPLSFASLSTVLSRSLHGTAMDCLIPGAPAQFTPVLIVNNAEGLAPGSYVVRQEEQTLEPLRLADSRGAASHLACDQSYAAAAQVNAYALTDLRPVLAHFGNRGYRLAQLEAALFGAKLQLAAHALGLGAVGSTAYDDEVAAFFARHPDGKRLEFMFVAVFGIKRRPSEAEVVAKSAFLQPEVS